MLSKKIKNEIIESLKSINPEEVILFGSYAHGNPDENSDIDLYVVTNDDFIPGNFKEKNEIYLKVARKLYDIEKEIPIDLIVHTKKMYSRFLELNGMFCRKIMRDGVKLI